MFEKLAYAIDSAFTGSTLIALIAILCLTWILLHIGQRRKWIGSQYYENWDFLKGGRREFF